ncbi:glutathione S-transferase [Mycena galopus ATCC 62051]|nr:glutathione S-transferase [Mycena galopus ATCC 62051]
MASPDEMRLYTFYRSSSSGRLRIALAYKQIPHRKITLNLSSQAQHDPTYSALNPSRTVPCLIHTPLASDQLVIGQSIAALEYLEERAAVRQLVSIVACDTQPLINRKIAEAVGVLGGSKEEWAKEHTTRGLLAFEAVLKGTAGRHCVGDEVSLADVVLVPMVWNAEAYGVDFGEMGVLKGCYERCMQLQAFIGAHWSVQEDCPEELRTGEKKLPAY